MVRAVLKDWRTAPVDERLRATLGFLEKLTVAPDEVRPEDVRQLRDVGVRDDAIVDAIQVCMLFSIAVRLADVFGFELPSQPQMRSDGKKPVQKAGQ